MKTFSQFLETFNKKVYAFIEKLSISNLEDHFLKGLERKDVGIYAKLQKMNWSNEDVSLLIKILRDRKVYSKNQEDLGWKQANITSQVNI